MVSRAQKIRLTIFLVVALSVLIGSIIIITGQQLFENKETYYIRYRDVSLSGLEIGSAVRYKGIRVGRIEDIYIDEQDITSLVVKISVEPDVPIKEDTEALVTFFGITGLKIIELQGGTNESEPLEPGSFIASGVSLVETMTDQAEVIARKLELILNNIAEMTEASRRNQIYRLVDNTSNTLESFQTFLDTNRVNFYRTVENIAVFSAELDTLTHTTTLFVDDLRKITSSEALTTSVDNIEVITTELREAKLSELIAKLTKAVEQTDKTFTHLDLTLLKSRHDILNSAEVLRESLENFNEFTRIISENPSLLLRSRPQPEIEGR